MSRHTRMFQIIQILRSATDPRTAQSIAEELEVAKRTVYRDIVSLQAMRIPILGEAGIGYVLSSEFDLPPVNFSVEEAEAITVGLAMVSRTGDRGLVNAARHAALKISEVTQLSEAVFASTWGIAEPETVDLSQVRMAIRDERVLSISYLDYNDATTAHSIKPIAIAYHADVVILAAWCPLCCEFRHFQVDRIEGLRVVNDSFAGEGNALRAAWIKDYADRLSQSP